ncbi:hypothetical protein Ddye_008796 [Dipteronia dyeriana]|uniref:Uncharacterized protein n=1 Tax=Dipteronia dyeriana TaxID=168575 RepID=A0AAD9XA80_9ROSI|nr:hypothetical protein Ddye_008796 [Dipteronia dyeriana]
MNHTCQHICQAISWMHSTNQSTFQALKKGTQNITDFLHSVKARADELALLGAPVDDEDLTDRILDELDDDYEELVCTVQARDNPITFDELHEKLMSFDASL